MVDGKLVEQPHPRRKYCPTCGYDCVEEKEKDHTEMQNRDGEQNPQSTSPNENAGQEEKPEQKSLSACSKYGKLIIGIVIGIIIGIVIGLIIKAVQTVKRKRTIIGIIISLLIFGSGFILGTLVPLNCQKDAIKCPADWIGHQGHCYNFSEEEKNWKESQNICISHTASLAKITEEEKAFVRKLAGRHVFWIGLKREPDQPWKWLDGENSTLDVMGNGGNCAFFNDDATASSGRCTTEHRYICKKN